MRQRFEMNSLLPTFDIQASQADQKHMLVGSGSYDSLDALREHPRVVLVGLECVMVACWQQLNHADR